MLYEDGIVFDLDEFESCEGSHEDVGSVFVAHLGDDIFPNISLFFGAGILGCSCKIAALHLFFPCTHTTEARGTNISSTIF